MELVGEVLREELRVDLLAALHYEAADTPSAEVVQDWAEPAVRVDRDDVGQALEGLRRVRRGGRVDVDGLRAGGAPQAQVRRDVPGLGHDDAEQLLRLAARCSGCDPLRGL